MSRGLDFCAYEDRATDFVALKLLALSLERHAPTSRLHTFSARLSDKMLSWLQGRPNVIVHDAPALSGTDWDIKADLLLWLLDLGLPRVVWIDADVILANDLPEALTGAGPGTCVAAEEPLIVKPRGIKMRAHDLGRASRTDAFDPDLNGGLLSVTPAHRGLLAEWNRYLRLPAYLSSKTMAFEERPLAFQSDQTVLGALLGSQPFQHIPIRVLTESREIAQCLGTTGYRPGARVLNGFRGSPAFIHAQGHVKPWRPGGSSDRLEQELSPYRLAALSYTDALDDGEATWLREESATARTLRRLFLGNPDLPGVPLTLRRVLGRMVGREGETIRVHPSLTAAELIAKSAPEG